MEKNLVFIAILCLLNSYAIHSSAMDRREQKRTLLINLIESNSTLPAHQLRLQKELNSFLQEYPAYWENIPFCQNMTLATFLTFHQKNNNALDKNKSISEKSLPNSVTVKVTPIFLPVTQPIQKQTISSHGCGKTNFACAFTCNYN